MPTRRTSITPATPAVSATAAPASATVNRPPSVATPELLHRRRPDDLDCSDELRFQRCHYRRLLATRDWPLSGRHPRRPCLGGTAARIAGR